MLLIKPIKAWLTGYSVIEECAFSLSSVYLTSCQLKLYTQHYSSKSTVVSFYSHITCCIHHWFFADRFVDSAPAISAVRTNLKEFADSFVTFVFSIILELLKRDSSCSTRLSCQLAVTEFSPDGIECFFLFIWLSRIFSWNISLFQF